MRKYVLTPSAKADLEEIFDYISQDNFEAAAKVVAGLEKRCRTLAERPLLGHTQPNLLPEEFRVFPVGSYLIVYPIRSRFRSSASGMQHAGHPTSSSHPKMPHLARCTSRAPLF